MPVNPNPIIDSLLLFDGIIDAYSSVMTSNGNKINYTKVGNDQFFDFTLAWGDCFSGCIYNHKWKFKVDYSNCIVEYIGLESNADEDFPIPINCNITSIENLDQNNNESIVVYPNPSNGKVNLGWNGNTTSPMQITVLDLQGKQVFNQTINSAEGYQTKALDLCKLDAGVYVIQTRVNNSFEQVKLVIK